MYSVALCCSPSRSASLRRRFELRRRRPEPAPPSARRKLGCRERPLVWLQQAHLDGFLLGHRMAHGAVECLTRREQCSDRSRGGTWTVFVAGTDRISSEADNHCTDQNTSNDIIAFHGGDPRSSPPRQQPTPPPVPF